MRSTWNIKRASLWEPETPQRDLNKASIVAQARTNPYLRNVIDSNSATDLTLAEKHPDAFNFLGNVAKTLGAAAVIGGVAHTIYNSADPLDITSFAPSEGANAAMLGGLGAAALGRYLQQPTSRTLARVKDNNSIPTNEENMQTVMNQSFTLGNKVPGASDYHIDIDKAYDTVKDLYYQQEAQKNAVINYQQQQNYLNQVGTGAYQKHASTDCETMPERDQQWQQLINVAPAIGGRGFETTNTPDRTDVPFLSTVTKVAAYLGMDADCISDILDTISNINDTPITKVAGHKVLAEAIKLAAAEASIPPGPMTQEELKRQRELLEQREQEQFQSMINQIIIPPYRR